MSGFDLKRFLANFNEKCRRNETTGCLIWTGTKNPKGYGITTIAGKTLLAHRVSFTIANDTIPEGLFVRHKCDNPACVEPSHLVLGTCQDNMRDVDERGRRPKGSGHSMSKLNEEIVYEMRVRHKSGETAASLSREYGVSYLAGRYAIIGKTWKHVPMPKDEDQGQAALP